jgi:hypothetical protein
VNNVVLTPNRNHPPVKSTDTVAPSCDDDLSIPASLRRNPDGQVAAGRAATNDTDGGTALGVVAGSPSNAPFRIFEDAKRRLAEAKTVDEVKSIRDIAMGLVEYAKQATDCQLEEEAAVIRKEAERILGKMMEQQKGTIGLNKGGRPKTGIRENPVSDQRPTLAEAGIGKNLAHRARSAAAMSDDEFQAEIDATREAVRTRTGSLRKARRAKRRERKRRTCLEKRLSEITAVCKYDDGMEIPPELNAAKVDAAIVTVTEAIGELNKLIHRLEETRPQK